MKRTFIASGLAAGLIAGAGAGLVLSASGFAGATDSPPPAVVAVVDDAGSGTPAHGARLAAVLQPLVDAGTIDADQLTAVVDALVAARPDRGGMARGDHGPGHRHGGHRGMGLDAVSTALGLDVDELRAQLREGATIAEVAAAQGIDVQVVIDAMLAEITERIDDLVNNGRPGR